MESLNLETEEKSAAFDDKPFQMPERFTKERRPSDENNYDAWNLVGCYLMVISSDLNSSDFRQSIDCQQDQKLS